MKETAILAEAGALAQELCEALPILERENPNLAKRLEQRLLLLRKVLRAQQ